MFRALPFPPLVSPPGSCTITVRSLMGTNLYIEAWLAADISLLKEALMGVFRCSADQMRFFLPDGLPHSPLADHIWIRRLPVIGNTRLVYLVVMDEVPRGDASVPTPLSRGDAQSSPAQSRPEQSRPAGTASLVGTAGLVGAAGLVSVCFTNTPLSIRANIPLSNEVSL